VADTLAGRLIATRQARGFSLAELGRRAGVQASTVQRIELEQHEPSLKVLRSLAQALEVDVAWLTFGTKTDGALSQKLPP
jgi:transcriptional regulator with XRE-family HTH domain